MAEVFAISDHLLVKYKLHRNCINSEKGSINNNNKKNKTLVTKAISGAT